MLWLLIGVIVALWVLGFTVANLGAIVHLLLVAALVVLIIQLFQRRRAAS